MVIDAKRLGELISNPNLVAKEEIQGLEEAVEKYPYASSLRFLLLKAKTNFHSTDLEKELESSANFVADREYLYEFLHSEEILEEKKEEKIELQTKENEVEESEEMVVEEETPESEDLAADQEVVDDIAEEEKEEALPKLEYEIPVYDISKELGGLEEERIEREEVIEEKLTEDIDPESLSFVEWLKLKKEGRLPKEEAQIEEKKEAKEEVILQLKKETKKSSKLSKSDINDLLDKFIEAEPKIAKPDKDFYNPVKTAKQSLEEQESLVTETLAKIHLLQKNYNKAIETYRRLILVYPEKKTYFATQIEKIRALKADKED
ncbi:MAG: hypothetical protein MK078_12410 [Crocinitomicaceae bacterium]|nr:hypothetical protein [Crocinitomicaceae bacterium]